MVNLRFHIVSIVAVFLALAIGLLTGVTLLDRAVVEGLKGTQDALDDRNRELRDQNSGLREQADAAERRDSALTELLPQLDVADLEGVSVVVLATRGIDEATARSIPVLLGRAGANAPGILWFDDRTDLRDAATSARLADVWPAVGGREPGDGETGDDDAEAAAVVAGIADVLHAPATTTTTTTTTTTSAVPAPAVGIGTEPATSEPTTTVEPAASDDAAAGLARL
ncbi:MAG TPA: copper transporter, partial [Microthrixaceae bacterium]|nr:copper transporter [Microthrixaceae bacterium]